MQIRWMLLGFGLILLFLLSFFGPVGLLAMMEQRNPKTEFSAETKYYVYILTFVGSPLILLIGTPLLLLGKRTAVRKLFNRRSRRIATALLGKNQWRKLWFSRSAGLRKSWIDLTGEIPASLLDEGARAVPTGGIEHEGKEPAMVTVHRATTPG
jgi:hypothetical protein